MHGWRVVVQLLERLDEGLRHDVREIRQRLANFHDRAAQVTHGIEQRHRSLPVRFREQAFPELCLFEPTANPVEEIGGADLGLERAEQAQPPPAADRHRP